MYFERFLEIYDEKFTKEERIKLKKEMDARFEKVTILYEDLARMSKYNYDDASAHVSKISLMVALSALAVSMVSLIIRFF